MTTIDLAAQLAVLLSGLLALSHRDLLEDLSDGNVERLEREERSAEACQWLQLIEEANRA